MTYVLHRGFKLTQGVLGIKLASGIRIDVQVTGDETVNVGRVQFTEEQVGDRSVDAFKALTDSAGLTLTIADQNRRVDGGVCCWRGRAGLGR
jgi:hypothetical protein